MNNGTEMLAPRARSIGIVVRELSDETLVYDVPREQAHALDRVTGLVWGYCDGETSVAEMTQRLESDLDTAVSEDLVWQTIAQLAEKNLLEEEATHAQGGMTRRDLMKKVGLAASTVAIASIVVPATAAYAACPGSGDCGDQCSCPTHNAQLICNGSTGQGSCNGSYTNQCQYGFGSGASGSGTCLGGCCMNDDTSLFTTSSCSSPNNGKSCCCKGKCCLPKTKGGVSGYACQIGTCP